jgi:DNA-binding response OmpR family regulator
VEISDGQMALDYLAKLPEDGSFPDLVLLDLNLPSRTGLEVLRAWKESNLSAAVPVLVMSSTSNPREIAQVIAEGARFFHKPVGFAEFLRLGSIVLELGESRSSAAAE